MKLALKKDSDKIWIFWAHYKAKKTKDFIKIARIKIDGYFYKQDIEIIGEKISALYSILYTHFESEEFSREEQDMLKNNLYTMSAQQFTALAYIMLEPYIELRANEGLTNR